MNFTPSGIYNFFRNQGEPRAPGPGSGIAIASAPSTGLKSASTRRVSNEEAFGRIAPRPISIEPYEMPDHLGRSWLNALPEEVLVRVFRGLDGVSLARCMRVSKPIRDLLTTNPHLALQNLLSYSSLLVNPNALIPSPDKPLLSPPSPAELLAKLRDRLDRFARLEPAKSTSMRLQETDGSLYEYLEGILLKSVGSSLISPKTDTIGIYNLRDLGQHQTDVPDSEASENREDDIVVDDEGDDDWEEVEDGDDIAVKVRRTKKFGFSISEFAVDPGQDLLILVEVKTGGGREFAVFFHLLSLETLEPHPLAKHTVLEWPNLMNRRAVSLGFQICDDGLFVLNHNIRAGGPDQLCGWQWTTGRLAVTLKAFPTMTFESFILLTPNSFLVPTIITHIDPESSTQDDLNNPSDLSWTHHLHLYAFPSLSSTAPPADSKEPPPPPHSTTHIATFDLPTFVIDLMDEMPPPRMTIRTDPPPRHTFPSHPVDSIPPFAPHPESGVIILEFYCQVPGRRFPHYVLACPKRTLIKYLPAPTSPLLKQAWPRQAPVVQWETLAPKVRMFGPNMKQSAWVCYVYQDRYVTSTSSRREHDDPLDFDAKVRLYDFNPLRVKRELSRRIPRSPQPAGSTRITCLPPPELSSSKPSSAFGRTRSGSDSSTISADSTFPPPHAPPYVSPFDGESGGATLIASETVLKAQLPLSEEVRTGRDFPYMFAEKECQAEVFLLDDERLVAVYSPELEGKPRGSRHKLEVMEF